MATTDDDLNLQAFLSAHVQGRRPDPPRRQEASVWRAIKGASTLALVAASLVVLSALLASRFASTWMRLGLPLVGALLFPWLIRHRLRRALESRYQQRRQVGGLLFFAAWNLLLLVALCLGFSDATGRALRRQGDWFVGDSESLFARKTRALLKRSASWLERFDPPPEIAPVKIAAAAPRLESSQPAPSPSSGWVHPLSQRRLPPNASCRFGAARPGNRPKECDLGHCGVDLAGPIGLPVFAIADGIVLRAVRDEVRGGIAGRFIILKHRGGAARSYYIHLDRLEAGVRPGAAVKAGERIGSLGRTGIKRSAAHLHFAVSVRRGGRYRYIDPEPLLHFWRLPRVVGQTLAARR